MYYSFTKKVANLILLVSSCINKLVKADAAVSIQAFKTSKLKQSFIERLSSFFSCCFQH